MPPNSFILSLCLSGSFPKRVCSCMGYSQSLRNSVYKSLPCLPRVLSVSTEAAASSRDAALIVLETSLPMSTKPSPSFTQFFRAKKEPLRKRALLTCLQNTHHCPGWGAQLVGESSCISKGCGFDRSLVRACVGGNWSIFRSHWYFSLSRSPFPSL